VFVLGAGGRAYKDHEGRHLKIRKEESYKSGILSGKKSGIRKEYTKHTSESVTQKKVL
jgi:hypothetical protein